VKNILRPYYHFFKYFVPFLTFNLRLLFKKTYKIKTKNSYNGKVAVLANGPSLRKVINVLDTDDKFKDTDFIVMNLFALDSKFKVIKPKHYCLSDPMFYQDYEPRLHDIKRTFEILDKEVDWEMYMYIAFPTKRENKLFFEYSKLKNPYLKFIITNRIDFSGYESLRNKYYDTGYCMPRIGNVANLAIYLAIFNGYKDINVYGVDHDFFLSWAVNEKNEVCAKEMHFYQDSDDVLLKPVIDTVKGFGTHKIKTHLWILSVMFDSHDKLQDYALYKKAKIINMTEGSMIDSYKRVK
jgi:hypothetical protein